MKHETKIPHFVYSTNLLKNRMCIQSWERALKSFRWPVIWMAIVLLLLNDHVFKQLYPSWFTGKLSDFAGLLVFPLILAILMLPICSWLRCSYRQAGAFAILITAVWFTLMKTFVPVNEATIWLWESLIRSPVQVVRDPTDLLALPILFFSWRIWTKNPAPKYSHPNKLLDKWLPLSMLSLGALASLATSCADDGIVTYLAVVNDRLYLGLTPGWLEPTADDIGVVYKCDDTLNCSVKMEPISEEVMQAFILSDSSPNIVCFPDDPDYCFRLGIAQIEESVDAGETWQVGWQVPSGRRLFMQRYKNTVSSSCPSFDLGPHDLVIVPVAGGRSKVVAAMGSDGLLIRSETGVWERKSVDAAYLNPTPFMTTDFFEAHQVVQDEFSIWVMFSLILILFTFWFIWRRRIFLILGIITIVGYKIQPAIFILFFVFFDSGKVSLLFYLLLMSLIASLFVWLTLNDIGGQKLPYYIWFVGIGLVCSAIFPMLLWPTGFISEYDVAFSASSIIALIAMVFIGISWILLVHKKNG